ncbi:MAG TPA: hypothetical protein VGH34_18000 [Vicinamibacterales bacterium]|jgi:hypothetical protein
MASSHASISRTLAAVLLLAAVATPRADGHATRRDAEQLKQKVAAIQSHAERGSKQPRRTTVTEIELNSYLAFDAKEQLPAGVVEPSITIVGTGRVSGRAVVDLDAVRKQKAPTSLLDPMNYLTGRLPVSATGVLTTSNGVGRFELESASISSLPIPKLFLQEIVSYYSRTADKPAGVSLDDPFALPSRIREIQVLRGQAIIVQ